jgi:hypothetical protein
MNLAPFIARLKTATGSTFKLVGGAADFDAASDALAAAPAAFVIEQANGAGPNLTVGVVTQQVSVQVGIVIAVRMVKDSRGQADQSSLEAARQAVRAALLGWSPEPGSDACSYAGGQLLEFTPGLLWWQDAYSTGHVISNL